jgi:flavodoxin
MKSVIVCISISHGNTRRVAVRMAGLLHADEPAAVDAAPLRDRVAHAETAS